MKLKREHLVPLCDRALQLLDDASESYLFPSPSHPDKHLSNMAMLMVLDRMGYGHVTVHGFRSTFKDWTRDRTRFRELRFRGGACPCERRQDRGRICPQRRAR